MAAYPAATLIPRPLNHSGTTYSLNHRDSLTNPPHQTLRPKQANFMSNFFRFHERGRGQSGASPRPLQYNEGHQGLPQYNEDYESTSPHWMSEFCIEPPSDSKHGALAVFLPCVLFSKTHWRLKRFLSGQNGFDSNWRDKDGCNLHCWAIGLWTFIIPILTFVPIMALRATVRGMYGIEGSLAEDYVISFFCPECVLVQVDREVRAREGQRELRNGRKFKKYQQEDLEMGQPSPQPQMAYVSPRVADEASTPNITRKGQNTEPLGTTTHSLLATSTQGLPESLTLNKGKARDNDLSREIVKKQKGSRRSKLGSLHLTEGDDDGEELLGLGATGFCEHGSSPPKSTYSSPTRAESHNRRRAGSQHLLQDCEKITNQNSPRQHNSDECAETFAKCPHPGVKASQHGMTSYGQASFNSGEVSSPSQHGLIGCETDLAMAATGRHTLSVCENSNQTSSRIQPLSQHSLTDGDGGSSSSGAEADGLVTREASGARKRVLSQHRLKECNSQSNAGSSENHSLANCEDLNKAGSKKPLVSQHDLEDCNRRSIASRSEDHSLAVCVASNKIESQKGQSTYVHKLPGCSRISQNKSSLSQHNLEDCSSRPDIALLERHTLFACEDSNQVKRKERVLDDHNLSNCETSTTDENERSQPEEHRLSACVRSRSPIDPELHSINDSNEEASTQQPSHNLSGCSAEGEQLQSSGEKEGNRQQPGNPLGFERNGLDAQHTLAECVDQSSAWQWSAGKIHRKISENSSTRGSVTKALDQRMTSCPVPSSSMSNQGSSQHAIRTVVHERKDSEGKGDSDNKDGCELYRTRLPKSENRSERTKKTQPAEINKQESEQSATKSLTRHLTKKGYTVGPSQMKNYTSNKRVARRVRSEEKTVMGGERRLTEKASKIRSQGKEDSEDAELN